MIKILSKIKIIIHTSLNDVLFINNIDSFNFFLTPSLKFFIKNKKSAFISNLF